MIHSSKRRIALTLSKPNVEWVRAQAPGDRSLSESFDALVQKLRTGGDPMKRLEQKLDALMTALQTDR